MEQKKLKEIISLFIKKKPENIVPETVIDKSVVQGSILIHRMYAELHDKGYEIKEYETIRTFGDLIDKLSSNSNSKEVKNSLHQSINNRSSSLDNKIGIDIEAVAQFNNVDDFRTDSFYNQNFSQSEISYCILQKNPLQSFAGKFAAKEALVKADNFFKKIPFSGIEILNDKHGVPKYRGFNISISHTDDYAVAFVIRETEETVSSPEISHIVEQKSLSKKQNILLLLAVFMSITSLLISIVNFF